MTRTTQTFLTAFALALPLALPVPGARAAGESAYKAALSGASEVPATTSKGTGAITASYDPSSKTLTWKGSYEGLTGPVTAAHFHGPAGSKDNAGVLVPVDAAKSPFSGSATLDETKAAAFTEGKVYFNVHTAENPKGEIRGQVEKAP